MLLKKARYDIHKHTVCKVCGWVVAVGGYVGPGLHCMYTHPRIRIFCVHVFGIWLSSGVCMSDYLLISGKLGVLAHGFSLRMHRSFGRVLLLLGMRNVC